MKRIRASFSEFIRDERGVTAIEYGLVASIISITIIGSLTYFGQRVNTFLAAASAPLKGP
jgi:pilus assembly protein Flp/PilA